MNKMIDKNLMELYETITIAIEKDKKDLSLIKGEQYERYIFGTPFYTINPCCGINRREALCIMYADYCDKYCFPFATNEQRKAMFLKAINNHFNDIA